MRDIFINLRRDCKGEAEVRFSSFIPTQVVCSLNNMFIYYSLFM